MGRYLDFENEKYEKGFKYFQLYPENIKQNIGKRICYVTKGSIDKYRGYFTVQYGVIYSKRYSQLLLNGGNDSVDIRDIVECGIEI